jgi:hypothetical protein
MSLHTLHQDGVRFTFLEEHQLRQVDLSVFPKFSGIVKVINPVTV